MLVFDIRDRLVVTLESFYCYIFALCSSLSRSLEATDLFACIYDIIDASYDRISDSVSIPARRAKFFFLIFVIAP